MGCRTGPPAAAVPDVAGGAGQSRSGDSKRVATAVLLVAGVRRVTRSGDSSGSRKAVALWHAVA
jgi:hypothetical protein